MFALLRKRPLLIGVVHLLGTPGSPRFAGDREAPIRRAVADAGALVEGGIDALIVENFGDAPFHKEHVPPETIASLALAIAAVSSVARSVPVGVNVLRNDARAGVGLCAATGASFLRVNVHVGAMLTDQGVIEGRAAETLRERARLCPGVALLADVHVKHGVLLAPQPIAEAARDALERGLADALVVSGTRTGAAPALGELLAVREAARGKPVLVGSGLTAENARALLEIADGAIVGTYLKEEGDVERAVDPRRVRELRTLFEERRSPPEA